jgi:hypothetical protein
MVEYLAAESDVAYRRGARGAAMAALARKAWL